MSNESIDTIIRSGAPTLAGIKTANLFGYPCSGPEEAARDVREINRLLAKKGICAIILCYQEGRALLYLFRPRKLAEDLKKAEVRALLNREGYPVCSVGRCVNILREKMKSQDIFPHEIGLFLGYPPEDVRGFIENKARNYKFSGYWKVYGNPEKARKAFDPYKSCTLRCVQLHKNGTSLPELAVSC